MKRRKEISLLLVIAMILSVFSQSALAAPSANRPAVWDEGSVLTTTDGDTYRFPSSCLGWHQIYWYDNTGKKHTGTAQELASAKRSYIIKQGSEQTRGYCIEHGVIAESGKQYLPESKDENQIFRGMSEAMRENIQSALLFGCQTGDSYSDLRAMCFEASSYYGKHRAKSGAGYNRDDWYLATQVLIWEIQQEFRVSSSGKNNLERKDSGLSFTNASGTPSGKKLGKYFYYQLIKDTPAQDIYDFMLQAMKYQKVMPKGLGSSDQDKAPTIKLTQDETDKRIWRGSVRDTEKILSGQTLSNEIIITKGSGKSKLSITPKKDGKGRYYEVVFQGDSETDEPKWDTLYAMQKKLHGKECRDDLLFWGWSSGAAHRQTITTGSADPIFFYFKLSKSEIPPENPPESERPEPEYFPEIEIPVSKEDLNPGWDGNVHTGMGDAALSATYVLLKDGEEVDRITLDAYGNTDALRDQPWEDAMALTMTESGSYTHTTKDGVHCVISPTKIEWTGKVTYEVREIRPDGRFVEPDSGIRRYEIRYDAVATNSQTCTANPEHWSEITYDVRWQVTEGKNTEEKNAHGNLSTVEGENPLVYPEEVFINDCYRGKLNLTKSLENANVFDEEGTSGGQDKSTKSEWRLTLKSGGYENHPSLRFVKEEPLKNGTAVYRAVRDTSGVDNGSETFLIGKNGELFLYDIPYGTYVMKEIRADDSSFVLEEFEVVIDEHSGSYTPKDTYDDRYDYDIRNKKIENVVKIIKTDAETGKKVALKGTKFRIRYMGNPLLADPKKSKNYGKLLPNAQNINASLKADEWSCDENGEITIPYHLEFGTYRLEEFLLPAGYFVGRYDKDGNQSSADYGEIAEGKTDAPEGFSYEDLVSIYDEEGNFLAYKKAKEVFNYYTFTVEKQETHTDGNFGQKVDYEGNIRPADPKYDSEDYPYIHYYKVTAMTNNPVKGKIRIEKNGELFSGFLEETKNGYTVLTPVYRALESLKGAVYGIYAAIDELLSDGSDGIRIYDSKTDEEIKIPKEISTHSQSEKTEVFDPLGRSHPAAIYESGSLSHASGAKLWYLLSREKSEQNEKKMLYVSPEERETKASEYFETESEHLRLTYDMQTALSFEAGGRNITKVRIVKTGTLKEQTEADTTLADLMQTEVHTYVGEDADGNDIEQPLGSFEIGGNMFTGEKGSYLDYAKSVDETENSITEIYEVSYVQQKGMAEGFRLRLDGFAIAAKADGDSAVTTITFLTSTPSIEVGAGYTYVQAGRTLTFTAAAPESPIYFLSPDGIKTEMYYAGGSLQAMLQIPMDAVDANFSEVVPTLKLSHRDVEGGMERKTLDWFHDLSSDNTEVILKPYDGITVTARQHGGTAEDVYYSLEIVSSANEDAPVEITFSDGYTMQLYSAETPSGNRAGIMALSGIYKTNRAPKSTLIETITTDANGRADSSLLPLGRYLVREISAPDGYVTDGEAQEVRLTYENQDTPLVWKILNLTNKRYEVEIDLSKVFETAYQSGSYLPGDGATFGIFAGEDINAKGSLTGLTKTAKKDSLIGSLAVDPSGKGKARIKLPDGIYYLKELSTKAGYKLNTIPFYFAVGESKEITSEPCKFDYPADGVSGKLILDRSGKVDMQLSVLQRYPMPEITIDGKSYALTEDLTDGLIQVRSEEDRAEITVSVLAGKESAITLPNGKELKVSAAENTYAYILDGMEKTYIPAVSYTGYYTSFSYEFSKVSGESLTETKTEVSFSEAGSNPNRLKGTLTHTPKTKEQKQADGSTKIVGMLDKDGSQVFTHRLDFTMTDEKGQQAVTGPLYRTGTDGKTSEEMQDASLSAFHIAAGEQLSFETSSGASVAMSLTKSGNLTIRMANTQAGAVTEDEVPTASIDGQDAKDAVFFTKTVTQARQDHAEGTLKIKVNTFDNVNAGDIPNDRKPGEPGRPTPSPSTPSIRTTLVDAKSGTHEAEPERDFLLIDTVSYYNLQQGEYRLIGTLMDRATGKEFLAGGKAVTAEKIFTAGNANGQEIVEFAFRTENIEGKSLVAFEKLYRRVKKADGSITETEIAKHEDLSDNWQTVTIGKKPDEPEKPQRPEKPEKPDKPEKPQAPQEVPKTGDAASAAGYLLLLAGATAGLVFSTGMLRKRRKTNR